MQNFKKLLAKKISGQNLPLGPNFSLGPKLSQKPNFSPGLNFSPGPNFSPGLNSPTGPNFSPVPNFFPWPIFSLRTNLHQGQTSPRAKVAPRVDLAPGHTLPFCFGADLVPGRKCSQGWQIQGRLCPRAKLAPLLQGQLCPKEDFGLGKKKGYSPEKVFYAKFQKKNFVKYKKIILWKISKKICHENIQKIFFSYKLQKDIYCQKKIRGKLSPRAVFARRLTLV